jgi:RND family efflux transporter MFP subunit
MPGYVDELLRVGGRLVQQGDYVQAGARLARVNEADYVARVNQARSQLEEALASGEQARQSVERAKQLFASKSLVRPDLEAAEAAAGVSQAKIRGARAQLQEAENALADCALKAPLGGVVLQRLVELGTLVAPGTPGFVIADTTMVKAVFGAPDVMVRQIKVGSAQSVSSPALLGVMLRGKVTRVAPVVDPKSNVFDVEVSIPNPNKELKVGMVVTLQVGAAEPAVNITIPITTITRSKGDSTAYTVLVIEDQGGKQIARLRSVMLGAVLGNRIIVTQGLVAGERVILNSEGLVADGEQVRVVS